MPDHLECHQHQRPFVDKSLNSKTMHFSIFDVQSQMRIDRPNDLMLAYTRLMMGFLLFSPNARHIAMVGLGGGSLAKFCYKHLPDSRIQVIEINPHVIALRDEFEVPRDNHRFHVRKEDAADYVRMAQVRYDVIVVDGFDANRIPARLCSRSFYRNCVDMLEPNGLLVANLHSHDEYFPIYLERIKENFAGNVVTVSEPEHGNTIAFAFKELPAAQLHANLQLCASTLAPEAWAQLAPSFSMIKQFGKWHSQNTS